MVNFCSVLILSVHQNDHVSLTPPKNKLNKKPQPPKNNNNNKKQTFDFDFLAKKSFKKPTQKNLCTHACVHEPFNQKTHHTCAHVEVLYGSSEIYENWLIPDIWLICNDRTGSQCLIKVKSNPKGLAMWPTYPSYYQPMSTLRSTSLKLPYIDTPRHTPWHTRRW